MNGTMTRTTSTSSRSSRQVDSLPQPPQQQQRQRHYLFHHQHYKEGTNSITTTIIDDSNSTTNSSNQTNSSSSSSSSSSNSTLAPQQPLQVLPETTAYWSREPYAWSSTSVQQQPPLPLETTENEVEDEDEDGTTTTTTTTTGSATDAGGRYSSTHTRHHFNDDPSLPPPLLTSSKCSKALYDVFRNTYYSDIGNVDPQQPNFLLSMIVESCSHPSGLNALYAQPYMYAGPGLGNMDICPLQTCIAGNSHLPQTNSIPFASICTVPECTAYDLGSEDFVAAMARQYDAAIQTTTPAETIDLGREYVLLLSRTAEINQFLKTGWTCGDFIVPFDRFPFGLPYVMLCGIFVVLSCVGTTIPCICRSHRRQRRQMAAAATTTTTATTITSMVPQHPPPTEHQDQESCALLLLQIHPSATTTTTNTNGHLHHDNGNTTTTTTKAPFWANGWSMTEYHNSDHRNSSNINTDDSIWSAFHVGQHLRKLTQPLSPSTERTACIDGLRVGSILWIILGHVLAIQSSSGAGYSNPSNFLPPTGLTTTFIGQLLFSSRLAVDTFLTISGYLVVHGLGRLPQNHSPSVLAVPSSWWRNVVVRYGTSIPILLLTRIGRILPLYAMSLGFFTQVAPQMGNGPFWHQWIHLLQPCHDYIWTNFLFINNFIPLQTPTTSTCFYHSWYIAVDMQLFALAPFLVFWYQYSKWQGQVATFLLFLASVLVTAYWSYERSWSVNTFDGSLVNRYDVEAYANPIIRAQAYFAGMYVAYMINNMNDRPGTNDQKRMPYRWIHRFIMAATITIMFAVTFITVTGAYARRPCTYDEDPFSNVCGSTWSPAGTFIYTAFGRTAWIIGVSTILYLCIGRGRWNDGDGNLVACVLSWSCWRPLSQLSFGAYLIHPIVVFVWQLGDREKQVFRLITFGMDYISVCVVSFVAALFASVLVECPCAFLLKMLLHRTIKRGHSRLSRNARVGTVEGKIMEVSNEFNSTDSTPISISPPTPAYENYGSLMASSSKIKDASL